MNMTDRIIDARNIWNISGDFGNVCGSVSIDGGKYKSRNEHYSILDQTVTNNLGVNYRTGEFSNISSLPLTLTCLYSKFLFDDGEYDVYTQYNGWQNESLGEWQPLVTGVSIAVENVRTSMGAAPMMALWNRQTNRGIVFHLIPNYSWEINVRRICNNNETTSVSVEMGINRNQLSFSIIPNEKIELPKIIYYEFKNKTDLDCYKLHSFCNEHFSRRELPIIYNTWLYKFDRLPYENVKKQIEPAARLGCEYFVIDAGWFGKGENWEDSRGDWSENQTAALCGRMNQIADKVRANGMKFGFWLEIETASKNSDIVKNHPDYYIREDDKYFFDFTNTDACEYMLNTICRLTEKYKAEFLKLDFNQDMFFDVKHSGFSVYLSAYKDFICTLKKRLPYIYIEGCSSGGMRTNLSACECYDSIWFSDNQSVNEGLRIYKDSILRMPPQILEKWAVIASVPDLPHYGNNFDEHIISTKDATWSLTEGVHLSFLTNFLTGGPIGFSCDLSAISKPTIEKLCDFVKKYKAERDFWKSAVCSILCDTESILILEYSDIDYNKIKIKIFAKRIRQNSLKVYPKVDKKSTYTINSETVSGEFISEHGIKVSLSENYTAEVLELTKSNHEED